MKPLKIKSQSIRMHKAIVSPSFGEKTILAGDPWAYVDLWLRRKGKTDAVTYWAQAKSFYEASLSLPASSSPLTLYYCFLNATKSLFEAKGISYFPYHGVSRFDLRPGVRRVSLDKEALKIKSGGILPSLTKYYNEQERDDIHTLKNLLFNLPFVHRAFCLSYTQKEIFLPIENPRYIHNGAGSAWFEAGIPKKHCHGKRLQTFPAFFQILTVGDLTVGEKTIIRSHTPFMWSTGQAATPADITALTDHHRLVRRHIHYIYGPTKNWYLKRSISGAKDIDRFGPTIIYLTMHRLSEMSRYKPIEFSRLLSGQSNWLIFEFIETAAKQFIDEMAAEITGSEFMIPGIRSGTM